MTMPLHGSRTATYTTLGLLLAALGAAPRACDGGADGRQMSWTLRPSPALAAGAGSVPPLRWPLDGSPDDGVVHSRSDAYAFGVDWLKDKCKMCGGVPKSHTGVDLNSLDGFKAGVDAPVYAAASGVVAKCKDLTLSGWGWAIVIDHGNFTTTYTHVDPLVSEGEQPNKGGMIAKVGNITAAGPHLHFAVRVKKYSDIAYRGALPRRRGTNDYCNGEFNGCKSDPLFARGRFVDPMLCFDSGSGGSLQITPPPSEAFSGGKGGPFDPPSITYSLGNSEATPVSWTATSSERWLSISPASGSVPGLSSSAVYVSVNDRSKRLAIDRYKATVTFQGGSTKVSREVTLTVKRAGSNCLIDVTWPAGGEILSRETAYTIAWTRSGSPCSNSVWVDLYQNGTVVRRLGDYKSGSSYQWTVPTDLPSGGGYRIRVTDERNLNYWGESRDFSIGDSTACGPVVESPNGGETWWRGVDATIYWHWNGNSCGPNVSINLYRGASFVQTIVAGVERYHSGSTRYFTWSVPASLPVATDYRIRIADASNPSLQDWSDGAFSITDPLPCTATVLAPNGGESWVKGTTHTVSWDYTGNCHGPLAVELYKGSTPVRTLIAGIYGKTIEWTVPTDISVGNDYRIRISMQGDPSQYDFSDSFFAVTDPAAGSWQVVSTITLAGTERPNRICVSGSTAYVTRESGRLSYIDLVSLTETGTSTLSSYPGTLIGVAAAGGRCYVADYGLGANGQLGVLDTATRAVIGYVPVGTDPLDVALTSTTAYVTISQESALKAVDRTTNAVTATIPVGSGANSIAVDTGSSRAYVTNRSGNSITIINTSNNSVLGQINTGSEPRGIALAGGRAFVALDAPAQVQAFDLTSGELVGSANVGLSPIGVATLPNYVFVTNAWSNSISVLDPLTFSTITTIGVGTRPIGVAADAATNTVFVVNYDSRSISVLRRQ